MKRVHLVLSILCTISLYGCTLETPLDLGLKCSDDEHKLSAIVYAGVVCTVNDLTPSNSGDCDRFTDSFKYGYCPPDYFCITDQNNSNICSLTSCLFTQHEHKGQCEDNTLLHCGQHGYECEFNTAGWVDGYCHNDIGGAKCFASKCEEGYTLNATLGQCEALVECEPNEHIYQGACEPDSLENCGRHAYACASHTAGWIDGSCVDGICVPSTCDSGYKLEKGVCKSLIECDELEHIYNGECEADGIANCGHHGNDCRLIEGWNDGNCLDARCFATSCIKDYDLIKEIGSCRYHVAQCDDDQHMVDNTCEDNSIENCGMHGYACNTRMPGWVTGNCVEGICEAKECEAGYVVSENKQCEARLKCDPGQHIANGDCVDDSVEACGSSNNNCTTMVGWEEGNCIEQRCVASACSTGYELNSNGQCVALTSCTDPNTHYYNGECVANDLNNCGGHDHACAEATGWKSGECVRGKCVASACNTGYDLNAGKCEAKTSCSDPDTHYYNGECVANDLNNCGGHDHACAEAMGWKSGDCVRGKCVASACNTGYDLNAGKCEAKTSCSDPDTHYYNGECIANDLNNCGNHNNKCSDITGWENGSCTLGSCVPSSCVVGYHLNSSHTTCVADDADNCGSVGHKCGLGEVCSAGDCKSNCGSGEVRCEKNGVVSCADPKTSTTFCGANNSCSSYQTCNAGQACINGSCVQISCSGSSTLCTVSGTNQCIELDSTNASHCGACNLKCSSMPMSNASSNTCSGGKCQYTCASGYTNCGSATVPNCISNNNMKTDSNNCGACNKKCGSDEYCSGGTCKKSTCTTNSCLVNSECINTNEKCGTNCINCNTTGNAASGSCNSGTCSITSCATGYHLSGSSSTNYTCVKNTSSACGKTNSTSTQNCNSYNNASIGVCDLNGSCIATGCKSGYFLYDGACIANSDSMCGSTSHACDSFNHMKCNTSTGICECASGYKLYNSVCILNNKDSDCNSRGYATIPGTTKKAYCIKSKADFLDMKNNLSSSTSWPSDNTENAFYLTRDIDLGVQSSWTPIATPSSTSNPFTFYGNGFKISGSLSCSGNCGLFNISSGPGVSTVENLVLNLDVTSSSGSAGALSPYTSYANLISIYSYGNVTANSGIAGGIVGSDVYCYTTRDLYVNGNVTGNTAGGIIGATGPCGSVSDLRFKGNVNGNESVGGIIGNLGLDTIITDSYVEGTVQGNTAVGGIIGSSNEYAAADISGCVFNGSAIGNDYVGGIIGRSGNTSSSQKVANSAVFGTIRGASSSSTNLGGIIGYGMISIDTSFSAADIQSAKSGGTFGGIISPSSSLQSSITTAYTTGKCRSVTTCSDSTSSAPTPKLALNWENAGFTNTPAYRNYIKYDSSFNPTYNSTALVTALNNAAGSTVWELRTCTITTGPANGSTQKVRLAIPKAIGDISICTK